LLLGLAPLVLSVLLGGCGARSGLDCFGERCGLTDGNGSPDAGRLDDDDTLGNAPPVRIPPREEGVPVPDNPPPDVPVDQPTSSCGRDGLWRGSLSISSREELRQLEGCNEVEGDLIITGFAIDDLSELRSLRVVGGTLELSSLTGSLAGLESLQSVNNLQLISLSVPSLAPLGSLLQVGSNPLDENGGQLWMSEVDGPVDLTGLGSIASLRSLAIRGSGTLQSLSGLSVPAAMNAVTIERAPALSDILGLTNLVELQELQLIELNLASLAGLQNLQSMAALGLVNMPFLLDLDLLGNLTSLDVLVLQNTAVLSLAGLAQLRGLENAVISNNPNLVDLTGLSQVEALTELTVSDNSNLLSMPPFAAVGVMEQLILRRNPLLGAGPSFPSLVDVDLLEVSDNPSLTEVLGFSALQTARRIDVRRNTALTSIDLSQLGSVRTLNISCNPALPESSVEPLASVSSSSVISGNEGSANVCAETL
jgi:hypothetical protein